MSDINLDMIKFGFEGEKGISDEILRKYAKQYKKNKIIIHEDDESDDVYYILKGSAFVAKRIEDKYKVLNILYKGELFGEMAVFDQPKRSATIISKEEQTICLKIPKNDFIEIFKLHPRWVDKIILEMSDRIVKMMKKI